MKKMSEEKERRLVPIKKDLEDALGQEKVKKLGKGKK